MWTEWRNCLGRVEELHGNMEKLNGKSGGTVSEERRTNIEYVERRTVEEDWTNCLDREEELFVKTVP